jgi:hypothetical protein
MSAFVSYPVTNRSGICMPVDALFVSKEFRHLKTDIFLWDLILIHVATINGLSVNSVHFDHKLFVSGAPGGVVG